MNLPIRMENNPACTDCELHEGIKSVCVPTVIYPDSNQDSNNIVVFIGQNPGFQEDQKNEPFIGRSGEMVKKAYIGGCSIQDKAVIYLTNGVRCHTISNETPKPRHYRSCVPYTTRDLHYLVNQWYHQENKGRFIVVTLGAPATSSFYKDVLDEKKVSLTEAFNRNGKSFMWDVFKREIFVFSTYHPAAVMRNNNYINAVESHMQLVSDCLDGTMAEPSEPDIVPTRSPRR